MDKKNYRGMAPKYVNQIIKEYTHWTLAIHDDQQYLGRAYVWLVREGGMQRFSEVTEEEYLELKKVMKEYEMALAKLWEPDFMNYAWLANLFHEHGGHGHLHLIPRYKDKRIFGGAAFTDSNWGKNYTPYDSFKPKEELLFQIRDEIKSALLES